MVMNEVRHSTMDVIGKLSPSGARAFASAVIRGEGREPVAKAAGDLLEWTNRKRDQIAELIRAEVRAQLKQLGVASREEVDALRRRVRQLEKAGPSKAAGAKAGTSARASTRRPTGERRSPAASSATATD